MGRKAGVLNGYLEVGPCAIGKVIGSYLRRPRQKTPSRIFVLAVTSFVSPGVARQNPFSSS